jgi:hypothetical protein
MGLHLGKQVRYPTNGLYDVDESQWDPGARYHLRRQNKYTPASSSSVRYGMNFRLPPDSREE